LLTLDVDLTLPPLAFLNLSPSEMLVVAVIALLLYGGDLPQVAREWGKYFTEFRRHLSGIRDELNEAIYAEPEPPRRLQHHPQYHAPAPLATVLPEATPGSDTASPVPVDEATPSEPTTTPA